MDGTTGLKETTRVTAPVASNTLSVNVFTAPGKTMVGERPKPFGEALIGRMARKRGSRALQGSRSCAGTTGVLREGGYSDCWVNECNGELRQLRILSGGRAWRERIINALWHWWGCAVAILLPLRSLELRALRLVFRLERLSELDLRPPRNLLSISGAVKLGARHGNMSQRVAWTNIQQRISHLAQLQRRWRFSSTEKHRHGR
jgi:hypothetical protein